ncbi:MAG: TMEM165/GDT1 family protein [Candidatus Bathyarchaeia archaeon]
MIDIFVASFALALLSEMADKTQLVILGLGLRYKAPLMVFIGELSAHAVMDGIAIALGGAFGSFLPFNIIKYVTGAAFIVAGLIMLVRGEKEEHKERIHRNALVAAFLTVMLSEFGDKTQIASGLLAARYLVPLPVLLGTVSALAVAIGVNVFLGGKVAKQEWAEEILEKVSPLLFIVFGVIAIVF